RRRAGEAPQGMDRPPRDHLWLGRALEICPTGRWRAAGRCDSPRRQGRAPQLSGPLMGVVPIVRPLRAGLLGVSLLGVLAGCEAGQMGFGGGTAPVGDFAILSAAPERAVLSAQGQRVAIEPTSGFCVAEDAIE